MKDTYSKEGNIEMVEEMFSGINMLYEYRKKKAIERDQWKNQMLQNRAQKQL